jgi:hypothetical protein
MKFPTVLYVKFTSQQGSEFFVADEELDNLVDPNGKTRIAVYQFVRHDDYAQKIVKVKP